MPLSPTRPAGRSRPAMLGLACLATTCLISLALAAGWRARPASSAAGTSSSEAAATTAAPSTQQPETRNRRNLSLQPEAFAAGRRLGKRFHAAGREKSVLNGTLSVEGEQQHVRISRIQDAGGERVEVSLGGHNDLTWDAAQGPRSSGVAAASAERALMERIVLDSADHFVLAQLRGASYSVVARNLRADEGGEDGYSGPLYNVVRVGEPPSAEGGPSSPWRLYYLNSTTGLVERVIYEEGGDRVEASLSEWAEHAGELLPTRVTWRRAGQVFMELTINNVAHGPRQ